MEDFPATPADPAAIPVHDIEDLKLLVVLDAILVEGSMARAGARLGKTPPVMSRLLKQLRDRFGDPLVERTAQGLVPTVLAETMRGRLRALVSEAKSLLDPPGDWPEPAPALTAHPPLALDQRRHRGMGPDAGTVARRIAASAGDNDPLRRFAGYIVTTGNAAGQTRPLTEAEAEDAFDTILSGDLPDLQLGGFLIALQTRGLSVPELTGFVRAVRRASQLPPPGAGAWDLDWPAHVSPRAHGVPLFVHAARLVARAGYRVLMHGPGDGIVQRCFDHAGLPVGRPATTAAGGGQIAYLPVDHVAPGLRDLHRLYPLFMMPNASQWVSALLNPGAAATTLAGQRGVATPRLQPEAAHRLGWTCFAALSGHRDAALVTPDRPQELTILQSGRITDLRLPSARRGAGASRARRAPQPDRGPLNRVEAWQAVWDGSQDDPAAETAIIDTAAIALALLAGPGTAPESCRDRARDLWSARRRPLAG